MIETLLERSHHSLGGPLTVLELELPRRRLS